MDYRLQCCLLALLSGLLLHINTVNGTGCSDSPCQNGGVCFDQPDGDFFCLCIKGFTGRTCIGDVETTAPPRIASTTVSATMPATTPRAATMKPTTENIDTSTKIMTIRRSSTLSSDKSTSGTDTIPDRRTAESGSSESSGSDSGDKDDEARSTDRTMKNPTPNPQTSSNPENDKLNQNGATGKDRRNYRWFLFLILFALLIVAAIITLWAVKRSAKNHGQSTDATRLESGQNGNLE